MRFHKVIGFPILSYFFNLNLDGESTVIFRTVKMTMLLVIGQ